MEPSVPSVPSVPSYLTIIAGCRNYTDYEGVEKAADLCGWEITKVISGAAKGADALGEQWARNHGVPIVRYPANWDKYRKAAGSIRNGKMAKAGEALIALWDGESRGTANMIQQAQDQGLRIFVYRFDDPALNSFL